MESFFEAYVTAALWSTNDESDDQGGVPLDQNYSVSDIAPDSLARMKADCDNFYSQCGHLFTEDNFKGHTESIDAHAGHDFWLTRNHHGAGFWDGDWKEPAATILTETAQTFKECDLYVGDDGRIHLS